MAPGELSSSDPIQVGGAHVVGRLGEGGMGVVYLGRLPTGRAAAIKVVKPQLADNPDYRARFAKEVATLSDLAGRFTPLVLQADVQATPQWMIMEYVSGDTLTDHVRRSGPIPESTLCVFGSDLALGLATMHSLGIVHRDLKPSNVILSPDGPKLLDFGVAHRDGTTADEGLRVGSLSWMAPEQLQGKNCGAATDVHALAALLYFAATGKTVFGPAEAPELSRQIAEDQPALADLPVALEYLRPILSQCFAKDPLARPTTQAVYKQLTLNPIAVQRLENTRVDPTPTSVIPTQVQPLANQARPHTTTGLPPTANLPAASGPPVIPGPQRPQTSAAGTGPMTSMSPAAPVAASFSATPVEYRTSQAPGQKPVQSPRKSSTLRTMAVIAVAVWLIGWVIGGWALVPWLPADAAPVEGCATTEDVVRFETGDVAMTSGSGVVATPWHGHFPGPFGEFRIPTDAISCQLGKGVWMQCPQYNLADAESVNCSLRDSYGGERAAVVTRSGQSWSWQLQQI